MKIQLIPSASYARKRSDANRTVEDSIFIDEFLNKLDSTMEKGEYHFTIEGWCSETISNLLRDHGYTFYKSEEISLEGGEFKKQVTQIFF